MDSKGSMRMLRVTERGVRVAVHCGLVLIAQASFVAAQCVQVDDAHACRIIAAAVVFEGTVEQIEIRDLPRQDPLAPVMRPTAERLVHLRDIRAVKGTPQDLLVAPTFGDEDCYYRFRAGQRYLVVATRLDDGRLAPSDLTRRIDTSAGLLAYIKTLGQLTKGELWGNVSMPAQWTEWTVTYGPVPEARVTVKGPETRSTTTDIHGEYRVDNLSWGAYTIRVDLPQAAPFLRPLELQKVELRPEWACAEVDFMAETRSRIEGVVVDETGQPAPGIFLYLHPADFFDPAQGAGVAPGIGLSTDSRGRYVFSDLPPARYVVGINTGIGPTPGSPYVEAYAATSGGETVVPLAIGGRATLEPLRLTRAIPGTVTGVVLNRNGDPVVGVDVSLWWTTVRGDARRTYPLKTDAGGRFRIPAWQGIQYRLEAGIHEAPSAQVAIPRLNEPITITLTHR
jgi:protocatechuate 3,4-dioxygenase beta subunit